MTTGPAFFSGWSAIWRVAVAVAITYVAMLTMLRISGKRTLAQTNVFDSVFIITLGSMAANTILSGTIAIAEGLVAIAALTRAAAVQHARSGGASGASRHVTH